MNARLVTGLSVGLNLALLGAVVWLWTSPEPARWIVVETNAPVRVVEKPVTVTVVEPEAFDWRRVESADYREYIANLRRIGCPEQTVRDIILADVHALYESRRQAVVASGEQAAVWSADGVSPFRTAPAEKLRAQFEELRQIAEEQRAILKELLGMDVPLREQAAFAPLNPRERLLTFLPAEKRLRVEEIEQRTAAVLMTPTTNALGHEQLGNFKLLQARKLREIAEVLTPGEFDEYQLRFSPEANRIRTRFGELDLSEAEFRQLMRIQKDFDEQFPAFDGLGPADAERYAARALAEREREEQLRAVLGADRFDAHERARDWSYRSALAVTREAGVPDRFAAGIREIKEIGEAEARRVRGDRSLTPEQRQATLQEVRTAVEDAVGSVLGRDGFESYRRQFGSSWLRDLSRLE